MLFPLAIVELDLLDRLNFLILGHPKKEFKSHYKTKILSFLLCMDYGLKKNMDQVSVTSPPALPPACERHLAEVRFFGRRHVEQTGARDWSAVVKQETLIWA